MIRTKRGPSSSDLHRSPPATPGVPGRVARTGRLPASTEAQRSSGTGAGGGEAPVQRKAVSSASPAPPPAFEDPFSLHLLPPVQLYRAVGASGLQDGADIQAAAAAGATGDAPLPHLDQIQRSFGGEHDLSSVRATVDGTAAAACDRIGAHSYAQGDTVAFKQSPDVWLAAHEAAHVVQQRQGAAIPGGVGQVGDSHERHADRVADAVAAGGSAASLLGGGGRGEPGTAVQRYVVNPVNNVDGKASETGASLVVPDRTLYAETSLVTEANQALQNVGKHGSHIKLVEDPSTTITQNSRTLSLVTPAWVSHGADDGIHADVTTANTGGPDSEGNTGGDMALWTDCGRSSGAVTGSSLNGDREVVYNKGGVEQTSAGFDDPSQKYQDTPHAFTNQVYTDLLPDFMADPANLPYLTEGVHYTQSGGTNTFTTITDAKQAKELYKQMTDDGQDAFDKSAGINHYADPEIGESYTMATEADMPGFKETGSKTWNFHWAGVVMKDGTDNVTLENFAVTSTYAKSVGVPQSEFIDRDWNFDMYGTVDKTQTFHQEHLDSDTHGNTATSVVARTDK